MPARHKSYICAVPSCVNNVAVVFNNKNTFLRVIKGVIWREHFRALRYENIAPADMECWSKH